MNTEDFIEKKKQALRDYIALADRLNISKEEKQRQIDIMLEYLYKLMKNRE